MNTGMRGWIWVLAVALAFPGCERGSAGTGWSGQVDTLANGVVRVRSPVTPVWDTMSAWRLDEELRIGSAQSEGPDLFGYVAGLAVDADRRIWVLDRQARELRLFGPDGNHLRTVGREGEGPGEFRDPIGVAIAPDGRVWVVDPGNARYSIHEPEGDFVETRRRPVGGYSVPWRGGFDDGGGLWERSVARVGDDLRSVVLALDSELEPSDTVVIPEARDRQVFELSTDGGFISAGVPFTPPLLAERAPDGAVWLAEAGQYRFHRTVGGDTVRVVERDFEPVPVTDQDRREALENLEWFVRQGGRIDPSRIPDVQPIVRSFSVDPAGRLWVLVTEPEAADDYPHDVFDPDGRYLGRVRSPFPFGAGTVFRNDEIYGVGTDELGVQQVVRVRLRRP